MPCSTAASERCSSSMMRIEAWCGCWARAMMQSMLCAWAYRCFDPDQRTSGVAERPGGNDEWLQHAIAAEAAGLITHLDATHDEISLLLEGIRCGACVWMIEKYLQRMPGVREVSVNFATRRARVRWDSRVI